MDMDADRMEALEELTGVDDGAGLVKVETDKGEADLWETATKAGLNRSLAAEIETGIGLEGDLADAPEPTIPGVETYHWASPRDGSLIAVPYNPDQSKIQAYQDKVAVRDLKSQRMGQNPEIGPAMVHPDGSRRYGFDGRLYADQNEALQAWQDLTQTETYAPSGPKNS